MVKENVIAILLDVGKSIEDDKKCFTALEEAKKCIRLIIQRKMLSESRDQIALILFGCDLSDDGEGSSSKYENVNIIQSLQPATWKLYELVKDIKGTDISTDFIREHALLTAINLLQDTANVKKIESRKILFFSDFDGGYFYSDKIDMICDAIKANNIEIDFIGSVAFYHDDENKMDVDGDCRKDNKMKRLDFLKAVNGESFSFSDVLPILNNYEVKECQNNPLNLNLEIGKLTIPISVYTKITAFKPKSWKTACAHNLSEEIKRKTFYCLNDEMQTKVSPEDSISAFKYGTTLVPYSEDDKNSMDYNPGERGMKVIGFANTKRIQRYFFTGNKTWYVFGRNKDESAGVALTAFIEALCDMEKVAIVRYLATARSSPAMGYLFPRMKPFYDCFIFNTLAFMEDFRHFIFSPIDLDSSNMPTDEQLEAVDELITAMNISGHIDEAEEDDDDDDEMLKPRNTVNPYVQRLYQCLQHRMFHPEKPLPEIEPHIQTLINPSPKVLNRAESALKKIKSLFPTKEYVPKKVSKTSNFFSNRKLDDSLGKDCVNEDSPEAKFNVSEANLIDAMTDKITQVGSINPVRDIQYLINNKVLSFNQICEQINDVVSKLLEGNDRLRFNYSKILSTCKEYRRASLKEADCEKYNLYMLSLQKHLQGINEDLWEKIRSEKITLISQEELPSSSVLSEEAENFLSKSCMPEKEKIFIKSEENSDEDEDNLMDQL